MENTTNNFIKILDEQIANALCEGGFSYIEEKINEGQTLYCFEESENLLEAIRGFTSNNNYQDIVIIRDQSLFF